MTKSWEAVREYVCKLYQEDGKSLSEIEKILLRDRAFQASTRAYRMKLKKWRAKRENSSVSSHDLVVDGQAAPTIPERCGGSESASASDVGNDIFRDSPSHVHKLFGDIMARISAQNSLATPAAYVLARACLITPGVKDIAMLRQLPWRGGQETLLHYAIPRDTTVLEAIQPFIRDEGISIDIPNQHGETALELAITSGTLYSVEVLLAAGASLERRNEAGEQPLHVAMRDGKLWEVEKCNSLLKSGADPGARIARADGGNGSTPIRALLDRLASNPGSKSSVAQYRNLKACLIRDPSYPYLYDCLSMDCQLWPDGHSDALQKFLRGWDIVSAQADQSHDPGIDCFEALLNRGFDPFVRESAGLICASGCCADEFACLVLFHTANTSSTDALLEATHKKYASDLVKALLNPCRSRSRSSSPSKQLRILLSRFSELAQSGELVFLLLEQCSDDEIEKADLLQTLMDFTDEDKPHEPPLELLPYINEDVRWRLAEILLLYTAQGLKAKHCSYADGPLALIFRKAQQEGIEFLRDPTCLDLLRDYLNTVRGNAQHQWLPGAIDESTLDEVWRLIVHAITKMMTQRRLRYPGRLVDCIRDALILRKEFKLPDIVIRNQTILDIIERGMASSLRSDTWLHTEESD